MIFGSPFKVSGEVYLCQSTVYLADDRATYVRETDKLSLPNCTADKPCPVATAAVGSYVDISGFADWQAPNQTTTAPSLAEPFADAAHLGAEHTLEPVVITLPEHYAELAGSPAPAIVTTLEGAARSAEALCGLIQGHSGVDFGESLQKRWRRNRFLYRWLGYCLRRGHRFRAFHDDPHAPAPELGELTA